MAGQSAAPAEKICVVCGKDVAKLPRVKDAAGHYICVGSCQETLKAKMAAARPNPMKPAPAPAVKKPEPESYDLMEKLIAESPMSRARHCTGCGSPLVNNAVVCVRCGMNAMTGKAMKTRVSTEKAPKQKRVKYRNKYAVDSGGQSFWVLLGIYSAVLGIVGLLPLASPEAMLISIVIIGIASLVAWIAGVFAAFKNDQGMWGIIGILQIIPIIGAFASLAWLVFNLLFNEDNFSRALYWATFLGGIVWFTCVFMMVAMGNNVELFGKQLGGP